MFASIDIDDTKVRQALKRLDLKSSGNARPAMLEIGRSMLASTQQRFRDQRGPDGQGWIPSARAKREGGQTLRLTSRLRNSITYEATERDVIVGTNVVYAKVHQFGINQDVQVRGHTRLVKKVFGRALRFPIYQNVGAHSRNAYLPARPFLGFSTQDKTDVLDILRDHLDRLAKGGS